MQRRTPRCGYPLLRDAGWYVYLVSCTDRHISQRVGALTPKCVGGCAPKDDKADKARGDEKCSKYLDEYQTVRPKENDFIFSAIKVTAGTDSMSNQLKYNERI